jgi:SAM-dependent methyltransferase
VTDEAVLAGQRRVWSLGDYAAIARYLQPISVTLAEAVGIGPGDEVLDVAVGDGNTAILAARAGATVTGVDLTPAQLELARARCGAEGVEVDLREGNAEALPFTDAGFDVVVSSMGLIFAPDHHAAASEAARVVRPGGRVGITAWAGGGWSGTLWERAAHLLPAPPPGAPRSEEWGDAATAVGRFEAAGLDTTAEVRPFHWELPSVAEGADFFASAAGPFVAVFEYAAALGTTEEVRAALIDVMEQANEATDGTCRLPAPYLLVVGRRRPRR